MAFSKTFPKRVKGSTYPEWEEVSLTDEEELEEESKARQENVRFMEQCIDDARKIMKDKGLKDYQTDIISMAISLFEKRASHSVYWKERRCKEKFDKLISKGK